MSITITSHSYFLHSSKLTLIIAAGAYQNISKFEKMQRMIIPSSHPSYQCDSIVELIFNSFVSSLRVFCHDRHIME